MILRIAYALALACAGAMIGWHLAVWSGRGAMKKIVHRTAMLLYAYGVRKGDIKAVMEVHLDNDAEVYRLVQKIQGQLLRPDASGGAKKEALDRSTQGG